MRCGAVIYMRRMPKKGDLLYTILLYRESSFERIEAKPVRSGSDRRRQTEFVLTELWPLRTVEYPLRVCVYVRVNLLFL